MVKKCPVYLHLPWLGTPSVGLENKIKASVEKCFFAEERVIFTSCPLLPAIKKDMLPALLLSNVVYNFLCHCDSQYIGCTSQRLPQNLPNSKLLQYFYLFWKIFNPSYVQ